MVHLHGENKNEWHHILASQVWFLQWCEKWSGEAKRSVNRSEKKSVSKSVKKEGNEKEREDRNFLSILWHTCLCHCWQGKVTSNLHTDQKSMKWNFRGGGWWKGVGGEMNMKWMLNEGEMAKKGSQWKGGRDGLAKRKWCWKGTRVGKRNWDGRIQHKSKG